MIANVTQQELLCGAQLLIKTVNPGNEARTLKAIKVCESYIYVIDNILLPTPNNTIASVPAVNSTFLEALIGLGSDSSPATSSPGVGIVTDPVSHPQQQMQFKQ